MIVMAVGSRNPIARRGKLYRELAVRGAASVAELCELFEASAATIRRDLSALQREGLVTRSYGGAAVRRTRPAEQAFAIREREHVDAKRAMAKAAIELFKPGDTVFLNDGSTVMALAREGHLKPQPLYRDSRGERRQRARGKLQHHGLPAGRISPTHLFGDIRPLRGRDDRAYQCRSGTPVMRCLWS